MAGRAVQRSFSDVGSFRNWLRANHGKIKVLWLVCYKKHTGRRTISYEDSVRQALCFGWIDSILKRLDGDRCLRKFTPRTDSTRWSRLNVKRAISLIKNGQMTEAGYAVLPSRKVASLEKLKFPGRPSPTSTPGFILERLRREPRALTFFNSLSPSLRRNYVAWILDAKREGTRRRRLEKAAGFLGREEKSLM